MIPVRKYVKFEGKEYEGLDDWKLWELLNFEVRMLVITEYLADRIDEALNKLGEAVYKRVVDGIVNGVGEIQNQEKKDEKSQK